MDFFRRLGQQLRDVWAGMSTLLRVVFIGVAVLLVALIAGVIYYRSQPEWAVLYTNLTQEDAQAIRDRLQSQGIPTRLSADGRTVEAPADRTGAVRIDLAGQGLPARGKGWELFDEPSLGATPFTQNVNFLRAKQAVIANDIRQLDPVANASVEIAKAEPSLFLSREKQPTTASVIVTLKPNATLTRQQVSAVVAFVSRAVEGLPPENVTVVDSKGNLLSEPAGPEAGAVASQLDYRRAVESYLAEKAQAMLVPALGAGHAVVKVTADINFQRLKEVRDTINPESRAIKTERTTNSRNQSSGGGARGVAGAASNLALRQPAAAAAAGGGGGSTSLSTEETTESTYDYSRTHSEVEDKLGSINRLTVAATVDLTPREGNTTPMTLQAVTSLIRGAVGADEARGDAVNVIEAKLTTAAPPAQAAQPPEQPEQPKEWWQNPQVVLLIRYGPWIIAVLAILVFGWVLIRSMRPAPLPPPPPPPPPVTERERIAERLAAAAERDPEALARAIAAMMERP